MFYTLSKILDLGLSPLTWAIVLALLAARRKGRFGRRPRRWPALAAAGVLVLFSLEAVSNRLIAALEADAPRTYRAGERYDAVVLLGGALDHKASKDSGQLAFNENVERLHATFDLLREGKARDAILSGGVAEPGDEIVEGQALADQLAAWGIDRARLVVEGEARNTRENAAFSKRIVDARGYKRVVIVTSAFHMRRAADAFRGAGLAVDTLPVDPRSYDPSKHATSWLPRASHLHDSTFALRELAGRWVYRLVGYGA
jgi:uncharacterized SAM-binding protein YcdF (DUF218 family)